MKKLISIFLLFTLTAPFVANFTWLQIKKNHIKKEVKWKLIEGIDREKLVFLKFSKEEINQKLRWKHSKEFEFEGEMYDIVEVSETEDSISYWLWWDHKETELNVQLNELISQTVKNSQENKNNQNQIFQFLKTPYCMQEEVELIQKILAHKVENLSVYKNSYTSQIHIEILIPPKLV